MHTCPSPHEMTWWSDKCEDCGHMLAAHRDVEIQPDPIPQDPIPQPSIVNEDGTETPVPDVIPEPIVPDVVVEVFGECSLCVLAAEQSAALEAARKQLADSIAAQNTALREYTVQLNTQAKEFASNLRDRLKEYVDEQTVETKRVAKTYVDTEIGKVPGWVNNRLATVVKAEALKVDPRSAP